PRRHGLPRETRSSGRRVRPRAGTVGRGRSRCPIRSDPEGFPPPGGRRTLRDGMGRRTRRFTAGALVIGAMTVGPVAVSATVPAGATGTQSTQTDLLLYSRPKSKHVTWTSTTPIVMVANVIKPRTVKTRLSGTVTFTVDGVKTTVPIKGLHHANLKFLHGLS